MVVAAVAAVAAVVVVAVVVVVAPVVVTATRWHPLVAVTPQNLAAWHNASCPC